VCVCVSVWCVCVSVVCVPFAFLSRVHTIGLFDKYANNCVQ